MTLTGRKRRATERTEAIGQRREAFKNDDWDTYRNIVKDQFMAEDQMCQVVMREVLEVLTETTEQEF